MNGCLYMLTFPNGKLYVGITSKSLERRLIQHRCAAKKAVLNRPLYAAIRKHEGFTAKKLVIASSLDYLYDLEQKAIEAFGTRAPNGYNLTDGGKGPIGYEWTENQRKVSDRRRGVPTGKTCCPRGSTRSPEHRAKISAGMMGHSVSEETRRKIGTTKVGNKYNVGKVRSDETKRKMSEAQRGKPRPYARRPMSEEAKIKISAAKRARPPSTCSHCDVISNNPGFMSRFHFDRCKSRAT
jgi:group I intron endonuclease